jgi:hypothetical protein
MRKLLPLILSVALASGLFVLPTVAGATITANLAWDQTLGTTTGQYSSATNVIVGQNFTVHAGSLSGNYIVDFYSDHCLILTITSTAGMTPFNSPVSHSDGIGFSFSPPCGTASVNDYSGYSVQDQYIDFMYFYSTTPGSITFHVDAILPNSGEVTDTPVPTATTMGVPTATPHIESTLPSLLSTAGPSRTPIPVVFPTSRPNGMFGNGDIYTPPTAIALSNIFSFGFTTADELTMADNVISFYKTANSNGAINILIMIFVAAAGIVFLFATIRKIGK